LPNGKKISSQKLWGSWGLNLGHLHDKSVTNRDQIRPLYENKKYGYLKIMEKKEKK
jgi:hypothetical protein